MQHDFLVSSSTLVINVPVAKRPIIAVPLRPTLRFLMVRATRNVDLKRGNTCTNGITLPSTAWLGWYVYGINTMRQNTLMLVTFENHRADGTSILLSRKTLIVSTCRGTSVAKSRLTRRLDLIS